MRGMKSHLKEVGGSGQALSSPSVNFIFSSIETECKKGSQRGLGAPRFQDRPETMGGGGGKKVQPPGRTSYSIW